MPIIYVSDRYFNIIKSSGIRYVEYKDDAIINSFEENIKGLEKSLYELKNKLQCKIDNSEKKLCLKNYQHVRIENNYDKLYKYCDELEKNYDKLNNKNNELKKNYDELNKNYHELAENYVCISEYKNELKEELIKNIRINDKLKKELSVLYDCYENSLKKTDSIENRSIFAKLRRALEKS